MNCTPTSLFLEKDASTLEEDIRLNLVTITEEALSVLELEVIVMVIGLWSETYFLRFNLHLLGLDFLLLLLLLIEELAVINESANRRLRIGGNFYEVHALLLGHLYGLESRQDY